MYFFSQFGPFFSLFILCLLVSSGLVEIVSKLHVSQELWNAALGFLRPKGVLSVDLLKSLQRSTLEKSLTEDRFVALIDSILTWQTTSSGSCSPLLGRLLL
jgi:hypothetical protein